MRKQMSMQLTLVVLCVLLTCAHGRGTVLTTMEIEEKLGVCWSNELVHADVRVNDASLYDPAVIKVTRGKGVAMPCQVSDLERNGDGSIASCKVWFYVDLDAGEKVVFAVERGKRAAVTAGRLRLDRGDGSVTISTANEVGRVGIRLPLGKKFYNTPVPATETSGPVEALLLPSGRETGQGRFEVPFKIRSVESEVIAEGPLFAEVRVRTVFDTGYWIFTARMEERRPVVFISEELDTGYSGQQMVSSMRRNLEKWQPVDRFYSLILGRDGGEGFKPTQMFYGARNSDAAFADILGTTILPQFSEIRSNWVAAPVHGSTIKVDKPGDIFYLTGFASVISQLGRLVRVVEPGGEAVGAIGLHTERWHNPLSIRIRVTPQRELALSLPLQTYEQEWLSDGYGRFSPNYTGKDLYAPPYLSKRSYALTLGRDENERERLLESLFALGASQAPSLDQVLAMTLDWDSGAEGVAAEQSSSAGVEALEILARRIEITRFAGDLARFSMAYHFGFARGDYKKLRQAVDNIDNDFCATDRKLLLRRLAFLAYDMHSQRRFPYGNGFHLNNPNMTMMAVDARLKAASLVKGHPMTERWGAGSLDLTRAFLERFVRPSGAPFENPHYVLGVTLSDITEANEVMLEQGVGDALDSDLVRRMVEFIPNWLTPPDPRFLGHRTALPYGNGSYQSFPPAMSERLVRYLAPRQPELAANIQWAANQTLPEGKKLSLVSDVAPQLGSVHFQDYGVFFRHGFGTPYETLFFMLAGNCFGHYELETDQMTYTLFAKGHPINLHFGNGYFPIFNRPWLRNRISIDHKREIPEREEPRLVTVALTAGSDYAHAMKPIDQIQSYSEYPPSGTAKPEVLDPETIEEIPVTEWRRQVLFLKDIDPKGPNYFVLRDSFTGTPTRRTDLSLWFLANEMERDGDLFHFDGQCGVDMDLFVAAPVAAEPESGSYGHTQHPYERYTGFDPKYHPDGKLGETQKFVRFSREAGAGYLVVLYPRLKEGDPAAAFTRLGEFAVRVKTPLSTDTIFLSTYPLTYKEEGLEFFGCATSIRDFPNGLRVVQNYEGRLTLTIDNVTLQGEGEFEVVLQNGKLVGRLPRGVKMN